MSSDFEWMRLAVEIGKKSVSEDRKDPAPMVGAVLVKNNTLLGTAYRGMSTTGGHAEFSLFESLKDVDLSGATLYTTLEPCSRRGSTKTPCAQRVIDRGIKEVVIGIYDPNPKIYREGWKMLRDSGIDLRDFTETFRDQIKADNELFLKQYKESLPNNQNTGEILFDYTLGDGIFIIKSENLKIETKWSLAGSGTIHAYDYKNNVVLARHALEFKEIDDPSAYFDHSNYSATAKEGEIVIFRNQQVFGLVKINKVLAGPDRGDDRFELKAQYELRRLK